MTDDGDRAVSAIREIVLRAASGRQHEALGELLTLTGSEDPHLAWLAAAAALPGMCWEDAAGEASVMVERIVERFGSVAEEYELSAHVDFDRAVAAGCLYDEEDGIPRLLRMASQLPSSHGLHAKLVWLAGFMAEHGPAAAMPLCLTEPEELWKNDAKLLQTMVRRGPTALDEQQVRRLWNAATARSRPDVLVSLYDGGLSERVDGTLVMYALAASLLQAGRAGEAEQVLLDARPMWYPLSVWETLPTTPVLNPGLRPLVSDRVVRDYLTLPVGEAVAR